MARRNSTTEKWRKRAQSQYNAEKYMQSHAISKLEGKDMIVHKINEAERHRSNIKYDISVQGAHNVLVNKLAGINEQLASLRLQLKQIEEQEVISK